ncbi:head processing protein [Vibrio fluvialis]|uniref:head processing protein n=1 Tax=Vibrio fluvialis TaxID=676 RepID=UPI001EEC49B8|nr:head processing protein [Vibrio fluvialis]MCG6387472.1 head processing protein [Vibrio fluvialis]
MKGLEQVSDRFSLFNHGRKIGANKRKYIVNAVQQLLQSEQVQEDLRVGELFGYWGHAPRQRAGKLSIGETEVIVINGKPVVVENIPSNVTVAINCDDNGIVSHTEEFLETESGRIARSLWNSKRGGWSWATGGRDSASSAVATSFHGVDYVLKPNYLSLDHPAMMLESAGQEGDMLLESLQNVGGFDTNSAANIVDSVSKHREYDTEIITELEGERMYLEGVNMELNTELKGQKDFRNKLLESMDRLPFFMSDEQKQALSSLNTQHDLDVVVAMFESMGAKDLSSLPSPSALRATPTIQVPASVGTLEGEIKLDRGGRRFG